MRLSWLPASALLTLLLALPGTAGAQVYIGPPVYGPPVVRVRPWRRFWRPRVVFIPRPPAVYVQAPAPLPPPPVYVQPPPAPPVYVQPPPPLVYVQPAPPVYVQPPAPVYVQPPPAPLPVPAVVAPPPPKPQWPARVGLGGRFAATLNTDTASKFDELGFGGEVLFRVARHLSLEVAGEYQRRIDEGFDRYDVPVTLGMRVHILGPEHLLSPYFVFASGLDYANLDFLHAHDIAWFGEGQLGVGLELRLGKHFAVTGDVRGVGRLRLTQPADAVAATTAVDGKPFSPMGNSAGAQFRLGAAVYF